jgi:hypothetical protein
MVVVAVGEENRIEPTVAEDLTHQSGNPGMVAPGPRVDQDGALRLEEVEVDAEGRIDDLMDPHDSSETDGAYSLCLA